MMRVLLLGILAIAATLGGHYAAGIASSSNVAEQNSQERLELVKLEPISAPVIRDAKVVGYVIARMSISAPAAEVKANKGLLVAYAGEAVFRAIYEEKAFDFASMRAADVSELSRKMVEFANRRIGKPAIREAVVESFNFVSDTELQARRAN
jgi:hypothetical protein